MTSKNGAESSSGPLQGLRVVDLSSTFMGPYATALLARLGAEVIKVEPPEGDVIRGLLRGRSEGMGPIYLTANTGKRSLVLDLKDPSAREALHKLVESTDIFVHNMRPRAAAKLEIDAATIQKINPRCIHAWFRGFGDGPYAERPAYDDVIQGLSGLAAVQGRGGDPEYVVTTMVDKTVGLAGAMAILAAVHRRWTTGTGEAIQIPMFEFMVDYVMLENQGNWLFDPPTGDPGYPRTASPFRKPYKTLDGFISAVLYTDDQWLKFFGLTNNSEMLKDSRFASIQQRTEHIDELYEVVEQQLLRRTTEDWLTDFGLLSIPAMPVRTVTQLFEDEHLIATGFFRHVEHPTEGSLIQTDVPFKFSNGLSDVRPAPQLGEHTAEILREAGCDERLIARIAKLEPKGAI